MSPRSRVFNSISSIWSKSRLALAINRDTRRLCKAAELSSTAWQNHLVSLSLTRCLSRRGLSSIRRLSHQNYESPVSKRSLLSWNSSSSCRHHSTFQPSKEFDNAFDNCNSHPGGSILQVSDLAEEIREQVRLYTQKQRRIDDNNRIRLVGILAQDTPFRYDAELYSDCIARTCQEDGIDYELCRVSGRDVFDLEAAIQQANQRDDVHGILVYYPIFKRSLPSHHQPKQADTTSSSRGPYKNRLTGVYYKTYDDYLRDKVTPSKDVEGLCHEYNARWLFRARGMNRMNNNHVSPTLVNGGNEIIFPCTAFAVMKILDRYHHRCQVLSFSANSTNHWNECVVTIVNRSEILGRPLAAMLALQGATVYSVDANSILLFRPGGRMSRCSPEDVTLDACLQQSSIIVTGVPSPDFCVPCESILPGTTVVNVSEFPNVHHAEALLTIPGIQYIPQVGKVTVAALELNLIQLHHRAMLSKRIETNLS